jgi:DNA helicase-2/ATP-dependent DNA helicase PcrA
MSRSSDVLRGLTLDQANAAALAGPVLVLAGAGTGKTKTLTAGVTHRIAVRGIPANRILAVTFTNKAAGEMRGLIQAALGDAAAPTWLGTFHGLGARQLRAEPEVAGLRPGFDIVDANDTRRMVK